MFKAYTIFLHVLLLCAITNQSLEAQRRENRALRSSDRSPTTAAAVLYAPGLNKRVSSAPFVFTREPPRATKGERIAIGVFIGAIVGGTTLGILALRKVKRCQDCFFEPQLVI